MRLQHGAWPRCVCTSCCQPCSIRPPLLHARSLQVLCLTDWRRKGDAYDLGPLGQRFPSSARPEFKPLPPGVLERAFTLQPGGCRLTEARGRGLRTKRPPPSDTRPARRMLSTSACPRLPAVLRPICCSAATPVHSQHTCRDPGPRCSPPPRLLLQADKGDLLQTNIGGFSTPATTAASGGVNTTVPSAGLGGPSGAAPTKIKLKVKKDKKVRVLACLGLESVLRLATQNYCWEPRRAWLAHGWSMYALALWTRPVAMPCLLLGSVPPVPVPMP